MNKYQGNGRINEKSVRIFWLPDFIKAIRMHRDNKKDFDPCQVFKFPF